MVSNEVVEIEIAVLSPLFVPSFGEKERRKKKGGSIMSSYKAMTFFCFRKKR